MTPQQQDVTTGSVDLSTFDLVMLLDAVSEKAGACSMRAENAHEGWYRDTMERSAHAYEELRQRLAGALQGGVRVTALGIIGRERALIDKLTRQLHDAAGRHHNYGPIRTTDRGATFEVQILDGNEVTGRIARVTVALDRVEPYATTPTSEDAAS